MKKRFQLSLSAFGKRNSGRKDVPLEEIGVEVKGSMLVGQRIDHLGLTFSVSDTCVSIEHIKENRETWKLLEASLTQKDSWSVRDVCRLCGVLEWDRDSHLIPAGVLWSEHQILSRVLARVSKRARAEYDQLATLEDCERSLLLSSLRRTIDREPRLFQFSSPDAPQLWLASDASDWGLGGVLLHPAGGLGEFSLTGQEALSACQRIGISWIGSWADLDINTRELLAAMLTVEHFAGSAPALCRISILLDNTAAIAFLATGYHPSSESINSGTLAFLSRHPDTRPVFVDGLKNIADNPSRGLRAEDTQATPPFSWQSKLEHCLQTCRTPDEVEMAIPLSLSLGCL
jgi:hypothetical protein